MRKWLAITGLVLTLLIAGVYVWSWHYSLAGGKPYRPVVHSGHMDIVISDPYRDVRDPKIQWGGWSVGRAHDDSMEWWFRTAETDWGQQVVRVPLWAPLLLTAISTYFLWPRPFRRRPGHCRACGYDLKGAPTSTCPECGAESRRGG